MSRAREALFRVAGWGRATLVPELELLLTPDVMDAWSVLEAEGLGPAPSLETSAPPPPYWSVAWAGGQALARWLLDHPEAVRGAHVVDFASGGGLVALAAKRAGAARVRALELDPLACEATRVAAARNGLELEVEEGDALGRAAPSCDVLLAGDVFYEPGLARLALPWLTGARRRGARVLVGEAHRLYAPQGGLAQLADYAVPVPRHVEGSSERAARVLELA
jgi:predicted nicotinamide N-methyase